MLPRDGDAVQNTPTAGPRHADGESGATALLVGAAIAAALALPATSAVVAAWVAWGPEVRVDLKRNTVTVGYKEKFDDAIDGLVLPPRLEPLHFERPPLLEIPDPAGPGAPVRGSGSRYTYPPAAGVQCPRR
jgi:hypothetical protein